VTPPANAGHADSAALYVRGNDRSLHPLPPQWYGAHPFLEKLGRHCVLSFRGPFEDDSLVICSVLSSVMGGIQVSSAMPRSLLRCRPTTAGCRQQMYGLVAPSRLLGASSDALCHTIVVLWWSGTPRVPSGWQPYQRCIRSTQYRAHRQQFKIQIGDLDRENLTQTQSSSSATPVQQHHTTCSCSYKMASHVGTVNQQTRATLAGKPTRPKLWRPASLRKIIGARSLCRSSIRQYQR
jgi:hypothetical protein